MTAKERSCECKDYYHTYKAAEAFLKRKKKLGFIIDKSRVYACKYCGGWHITTKELRK